MNPLQPHAIEAVATRTIPVLGGFPQVVTLQVSYWECLDYMVERKDITLEKISDFCWRYCQRNPETPFAASFEYYIHCYMMDDLKERYNLANDNYFDLDHVWEKKPSSYRIKLTKIPSFCAG
jgi:hypothetical protein